uniref:NADH-ubiquinone oxidoreductase chain 3 n=1 Tax=Brillia brevicornis TaxID=2970799 RepID=A0A976UF81_9DIPT|nr:NADH dehydrogenase subunit 3 [Brillia brevicornis]UVG40809.1 NADH dehydrogenase subunit 3 [Brillia brevicornis]
MFYLLTMNILILLISSVVMILSTLLAKKKIEDREKSSPFECGFDPMNSSRLPFSIQFFLIAIIFLIFDVEIALILPIIMIFKFSNMKMLMISSIFFIFILLAGLYHEWNQGMLNWTI